MKLLLLFWIFNVVCRVYSAKFGFQLCTMDYVHGRSTGWFQICIFDALFFSEDVVDAWVLYNFISFLNKTISSDYSKYSPWFSHFFTAPSQALNIDFCSGV